MRPTPDSQAYSTGASLLRIFVPVGATVALFAFLLKGTETTVPVLSTTSPDQHYTLSITNVRQLQPYTCFINLGDMVVTLNRSDGSLVSRTTVNADFLDLSVPNVAWKTNEVQVEFGPPEKTIHLALDT